LQGPVIKKRKVMTTAPGILFKLVKEADQTRRSGSR